MGNNPSFFSFGPNESFITRSFAGLEYHNLPPKLHELLCSEDLINLHFAVLGPLQESWVLVYDNDDLDHKISWGDDTPWELQEILKTLRPSTELYIFLGPRDSFIAWDPTFIRWIGLPAGLEDCLQGWLTPSGWRVGPPRMVTWGRKGAYFALSQYGEVDYHLGTKESWPIFKETVQDWECEAGFHWRDIACIVLDSTTPDQFVAIRQDRTWAGSIEDRNEEALESFALHFFPPDDKKCKPKTENHEYNYSDRPPKKADETPDTATQALYTEWATKAANAFASALAANGGKGKLPKKLEIRNQTQRSPTPVNVTGEAKLLTRFPYLPGKVAVCNQKVCVIAKADPSGLRACKHDVERLFRASGSYSYEWLRQERIRWHPDRFGWLCQPEWRDTGRKLAEEMFKIIESLMADLMKAGANRTSA